jgi:hypothetical protein
MKSILDRLEWFTKYGFTEMVFGFGVIAFLARIVRKAFPMNYDHLHISVSPGGAVSIPGAAGQQSIVFTLSNAGQTNVYVARAFFRSKLRRWWWLWLKRTPTKLRVHPLSAKIAHKDAFELKFQGPQQPLFSSYEAYLPPGTVGAQITWLALEQRVQQVEIENRRCGVLYIEYATSGKQGVHTVRV